MSRADFEISYDGPQLAHHSMDVQQLAPALLAIGDLIREVNAELNGGRATVRVNVKSNFEHKCFNVGLEIIQSVLEQLKGLADSDNLKDAKEVLAWAGIIGSPIVGGLLTYLKLRKGRPIANVTKSDDSEKSGNVSIQFQGDQNSVTVHNHIYRLGETPKVRRAVNNIMAPVNGEDIDKLEIKGPDETNKEVFRSDDARAIVESCTVPASDEQETGPPQTIETLLKVYAPVYDSKANRWRFWFGEDHIYADITETTIAKDALQRGGTNTGDTYRVKLQITQHETPENQVRNEYKILQVLDFHPSPRQIDMSSEWSDDGTDQD